MLTQAQKAKPPKPPKPGASTSTTSTSAQPEGATSQFEVGTATEGEEFTPQRWTLGTLNAVIPTKYATTPPPVLPPPATLDLQFALGYRGRECRNNIVVLDPDRVAYHVAALGIVYNRATNTQRFFTQHNQDITCLTGHPAAPIIATGQVGKNPSIYVWDANSMQTIAQFKGHTHGIACMAFSPDGNYLASVGLDDDHMVMIWDLVSKSPKAILSATGGKNMLLAIRFDPKNPGKFVTVGVKVTTFWDFSPAQRLLKPTRGIMGEKGTYQTFTSIGYLSDSRVVTGCASGELYLWREPRLTGIRQYHKSRVQVIYPLPDGILSLDSTGVLARWKLAGTQFTVLNATQLSKPVEGEPRALSINNSIMAIGTASNVIALYEVDPALYNIKRPIGPMVDGHFDEMWGLFPHPQGNLFITTADDQTLRVWDPAKQRLVTKMHLPGKSRVCAFSHNGQLIAVGTEDGKVYIHEYPSLKPVSNIGGRVRQISEIKFSPDDTMMCVGTHESVADMYGVPSFQKIGSLVGHSSWIAHLDWDKNSTVVRTNCGAYELLYWDAKSCKQITAPGGLKDYEWDTESCTITWHNQGIWPPVSDGSDINAVCVNKDRNFLIMGNDFRQVQTAAFPCLQQSSPKGTYFGHSEHVTNVSFVLNDSMAVSIGGLDASVLLWRVIPAAQTTTTTAPTQ